MARVERRQRQQRREEEASKDEAVEKVGEPCSNRDIEEVLSEVPAAQAVAEVTSVTEHDKVES